ncbi:MAG: hypothetical protein A2234_06130 [Elusimicrobia bacterium RIFOXYA2_FULL_58_8]|nr:MAG: hypothetical protein A2285_07580 [Elusimicrobia bacterium RIFOXYA12_FULL_57_11]OGS15192.1 MAG: hypothetical protein A2234_06130 [Elusimicrobia bacterium RIFOXYA2_FULL_58_8]
MLSLIELALIPYKAVIDGVLKHVLVITYRKGGMPPFQANLIHYAAYFGQRVIAGGIQLKGLPDKDRPVFIRIDRLGVLVVQVAERGTTGPNAVTEFLSEAAPDIFRKVVNVVFGLAKRY